MSLRCELSELRCAIEGARLIAQYVAENPSVVDGPDALISVLTLVGLRLKKLCRILSGDLNPRRMLEPHNESRGFIPGDPDVFLQIWGLEDAIDEFTMDCRELFREPLDDRAKARIFEQLRKIAQKLNADERPAG